MTEQDWLTSQDPVAMLAWVTPDCDCMVRQSPGSPVVRNLSHLPGCRHTSDRKLRLFACACCRQVWHLLTDERSRRAVGVAEWFADNPTAENAAEARRACSSADDGIGHCVRSLHGEPRITADNAAHYTRQPGGMTMPQQADLYREIVGNPFRPVINSGWDLYQATPRRDGRTIQVLWSIPHSVWRTPTVLEVAQSVYDDRAFAGLPILADALEDAGWAENPILAHLRGPGSHVRGCWVLDLILGLE